MAVLNTIELEGVSADSAWTQQLVQDFLVNLSVGINGSGYERARPPSYVFMLRPNPVEEAVLAQWGLRMLTEKDCPPEAALETFLAKLADAVEGDDA